MTYLLLMETAATNSAAGFLADDAVGLQAALEAIDQLTDDPRPAESTPFGSPDVRRLRTGRYRALYRISADTITVFQFGRTSKPV